MDIGYNTRIGSKMPNDQVHSRPGRRTTRERKARQEPRQAGVLYIKGTVCQNHNLIESHILYSNGEWYSSFWSEGTLQSQVPDIYLSQFNSYGGIDKGQLFHFASPQLSLSSPSPSPDYSFLRQAELNCTVLVKEERMLINLHH